MVAKPQGTCTGNTARSKAGLIPLLALFLVLPFFTGCLRGVRTTAHVPAPPATYTCVATPSSVFAGDPVRMTGNGVSPDSPKLLHYSWQSTGGKVISPNTSTMLVDTNGLAPGSYTVTGTVKGSGAGTVATCSTAFQVRPIPPPTIACSASPDVVTSGGTTTISSVASQPNPRPLQFAYSTTSGNILSGGSTATLDATGVSPGTITVTCTVTDDKGNQASSTALVRVLSVISVPPPPPAAAYSCRVSQSRVRAGDPVEVSVWPQPPAGTIPPRIQVHSTLGVLDAGADVAVLDTYGLAPGRVAIAGDILLQGRHVGTCDTTILIDPTAPVASWRLDLMRVALLPSEQESPGFAVYTYLLYSKQPTNDQQKQRLKSIFAEIESRNPTAISDGPVVSPAGVDTAAVQPSTGKTEQKTSRRDLAPIVVPVREQGDEKADWFLAHYDTQHAARLIRTISCDTSKTPKKCARAISGDGPFLISSTVRLSARPRSMLVQDLSALPPDLAGEWVGAFLKMVTQKRNWTGGYTTDQIRLDASSYLDRAGGVLTQSHDAVLAAMKLLSFGK